MKTLRTLWHALDGCIERLLIAFWFGIRHWDAANSRESTTGAFSSHQTSQGLVR